MEWLKLKLAGLNNKHIRLFMNEYKSYEEIFEDYKFKSLNDEIKRKLEKSRTTDVNDIIEKYNSNDIRIVNKYNEEYPKQLLDLIDYPLFLFIKGKKQNYKKEKILGVIGTRDFTVHGKVVCEQLTRELTMQGITIVSGLARGIDTIALKASIEKNGNTIAVVGSGLDIIYPPENKYLWEKISTHGTIISEYPLGVEPFKYNFPKRNRIIAALSTGVLVAESFIRGGSLITAELAYDLNRDLFAVPGFVNFPSFEGCNELIKQNKAKLVTSAQDIIEELSISDEVEDFSLSEIEQDMINTLVKEKSILEVNKIFVEKYNKAEIFDTIIKLKLKKKIVEKNNSKYIKL